MKKLVPHERCLIARRNHRDRRNQQRKVGITKACKIRKWRRKLNSYHANVRGATKWHEHHAPSSFDIVNHDVRQNLLLFLKNLQQDLKAGKWIEIDFDRKVSLAPAGTLMFVAKIETLLANYPGRIVCKYPKNDVVEQLFQHIGLLSKFGLKDRATITADNVRYWHYARGDDTNTSGFKSLFLTYSKRLESETSDRLYDNMSEAVTNSINHAYVSKESRCDAKRWWMFAQSKDGKLSVAVADLGIGIPDSLSSKPEMKRFIPGLLQKHRKRKDAKIIESAIHSDRSRTHLPHRGKGLPEMLEFVKAGKVGGFRIFSRYGLFCYSASTTSESSSNYRYPIEGTLIEWEIELPN